MDSRRPPPRSRLHDPIGYLPTAPLTPPPPTMRQYKYQATDATVEAMRRLRAPWVRLHVIETAVTVVLADETAVIIDVEAADVEDAFEAFRLRAVHDRTPMVYGEPEPALAAPGNDVVLFTGATWSEAGGTMTTPMIRAPGAVSFSGHPGQLSEQAEVVCLTTDAVVIASADGAGVLIRTGLKPYALQLVRDPEQLRAFLRERGYAATDDGAGTA
jgi:hypothetical protein